LLDYEERWDDLERSLNPFAVVVMAHLRVQLTRKDPESRFAWKLTLTRMLYERGYGRKEIMEIFRFIDWLMVLPQELENNFVEALRQYEEEKKMRYVTTFERMGMLQKAREDVLEILEARFGGFPQDIRQAINGLDDVSLLKVLLKKAALVASLQEFEEIRQKTVGS
ncbi:MAG: transposase, partial [Candidatus Tectomicrobia bacterium]|nr:transposase [Candidatus Tectomicrobia bacterium]